MLRTTALLAPFLLLGVNGQHDGHDHGGSHAGHDHGSSSSSSVTTHEWAGIFPVSGTTQVWRAQKVNGAYADPMMGMVIVPATESSESMLTSLVPESATGFATTCTVVHNGETITPRAGVCYTLEFGSGSESTYTIDTTGVSHVAIFAEHFPTEFESDRHYLQDAADADVEPIATIPFTPGLVVPWGLAIGATITVAITTWVGVAFLVPGVKGVADKNPNTFGAIGNAFAAGALLAAAFFLILHEATHYIIFETEAMSAAIWGIMILVGFITASILDLFVAMIRGPEKAETETDKAGARTAGSVEEGQVAVEVQSPASKRVRVLCAILLGDFVHNLCDGLFIGIAFNMCGGSFGWTVTAATVYHEIAQELSDYLVLTDPKQGNLSPFVALLLNFISGLSVILGAVIVLAQTPDNKAIGMLLAYSGGVYVQIGAGECMGRVYAQANTICLRFFSIVMFLVGATAIGLVLLNHEHCSVGGDAHAGHNH